MKEASIEVLNVCCIESDGVLDVGSYHVSDLTGVGLDTHVEGFVVCLRGGMLVMELSCDIADISTAVLSKSARDNLDS